MNRVLLFGTGVLLLFAIGVSHARPQEAPLAEYPTAQTAVPAGSGGLSTTSTTSTAAPEESKVSKFFDDVSSVFKQGTAKVKESFENAATSVKDGVMRGYDYVKDKFSGNGDAVTTPGSPASSSTTTGSDPLTSTGSEKTISSVKSAGNNAAAPTPTTKPVRVEPNDEEPADDDRLIFIGDEDTATDLTPNTTPKTSASTTPASNLDDRFILDGPLACPKGQKAVNGVCRNTF
uniref:Possible mucin n=1 Tax=Aedes aegypti TaxID=7159 RepID=Q1HQG1_AEDAE|nr:possible mucin [Aedes aegypti]